MPKRVKVHVGSHSGFVFVAFKPLGKIIRKVPATVFATIKQSDIGSRLFSLFDILKQSQFYQIGMNWNQPFAVTILNAFIAVFLNIDNINTLSNLNIINGQLAYLV